MERNDLETQSSGMSMKGWRVAREMEAGLLRRKMFLDLVRGWSKALYSLALEKLSGRLATRSSRGPLGM